MHNDQRWRFNCIWLLRGELFLVYVPSDGTMMTISNALSNSSQNQLRSSSPSKWSSQSVKVLVLTRVNNRVDVEDRIATKGASHEGTRISRTQQVLSVAKELCVGARELYERRSEDEPEWSWLMDQSVKSLSDAIPDRFCCLSKRSLFTTER